jgi:hypothetical protein
MGIQNQLQRLSDYVDAIEPLLPRMVTDGYPFAILGDSDGDACLFNGLLSTVCPKERVNYAAIAVLASQGDNGMFYRSPRRRETNNEGFGSLFSRDQAMGVLCAATLPAFNGSAWNDWCDYIDGSRPCLKKKPKWLGGGCWVRSPIYYYAMGDDRCQITPIMWALMGRVSSHRGWDKNSEMEKWNGYDGDACVLQAQNCQAGYELHLEAVGAYLKFLMGQSREYSVRIGEIAHRRVPDNLFYRFLATREIDETLIENYFNMAPPIDSVWGNSWVWEKSLARKELSTCCGWDFVFLGKLILRFAVS